MSENLEDKSKKKRNAYVTSLQKEKLVDYITSNYGVLYGNDRSADSRATKDGLWNNITTELNKIGAQKDVAGWKRCYTSLKCSTNRKVKNSVDEISKNLNASEMKIIDADQSNPRTVLAARNERKVTQSSSGVITTGTYSTPQQREELVSLVSANFDALYGKLSNSANGAAIKKTVWKSIAIQLNAIGPKKDEQGWIRCFTGLKAATKEKLSVIRQNKNRNGQENVELDGMQLEMHKMHHPDTLDGCQILDELGFGNYSVPVTSPANDCALETDADSPDELQDPMDFNGMKKDFEKLKEYVAGCQENAVRIDKNAKALLERIDDATKLNDEPSNFLADSTKPFNVDPSDAMTASGSEHAARQTPFLKSSSPLDDGNIIDYSDLTADEQIALLITGQLSPDSMHVADNAVRIEDMDIEFDASAGEHVENDQTKTSNGDKVGCNGSNIVVLENILITNAFEGPPKSIEANIQAPMTSARNPVLPIRQPTLTQEDGLFACQIPSKHIETNIQVLPTVTVADVTQSVNSLSTQQQPQRRGVEINLNKFADSDREVVVKSKEKGRKPRRNRLSTPLGVMAQRALDEQIKTNSLLTEILSELRGKK